MITHLWEVGSSTDITNPDAPLLYRIEIMGVDRDVSFRETFEEEDPIKTKLRVMDFIINHHKLKGKP